MSCPDREQIKRLIGQYLDIPRLLRENPSIPRKKLNEVLNEMGIQTAPPRKERVASVILYTDGASSGNPGPSGIGVVVTDDSGRRIAEISEAIGRATSNVAEYKALLAGLEEAARLGAERVTICADSELLVRQLNGQYRVKSPHIRPLWEEAMERLAALKQWSISHVSREHNWRADALARKAIEDAACNRASDNS